MSDTLERTIGREAEKLHGTIVRWRTPLDNYPNPRNEATGFGMRYTHPVRGNEGFKLFTPGALKDVRNANLILDDGRTAEVYYCAGWNENGEGFVIYHPFPVNPDGRRRPDNGRVVDYSNWVLGPRRTYHLKLTPVVGIA